MLPVWLKRIRALQLQRLRVPVLWAPSTETMRWFACFASHCFEAIVYRISDFMALPAVLRQIQHSLVALCLIELAVVTGQSSVPCRSVMQYLRATGAAQLYAGAMSPPAAEQIISALQLIQDADGTGRGPRKLAQLRENSNYFREKLQDIGLNVLGDADSPVMVCATLM